MPETEEELKKRFAIQELELNQASMMQKYNNIVEQALFHIHSYDTPEGKNYFLEEEGILRQSGEKTKMDAALLKMMDDPAKYPLSSFKDFTLFPHNVTGLIKTGLREWAVDWSEEARNSFKEFNSNPNMSFDDLIEDLIAKNALEEAKVLHNLLHLCHIVNRFEAKNKMKDSNIHINFAPSLAIFLKQQLALDPSTQLSAYSEQELEVGAKRMIKAIKDPKFAQSFDKTHPTQQQKLSEEYKEKFPLLSASQNLSESQNQSESKKRTSFSFIGDYVKIARSSLPSKETTLKTIDRATKFALDIAGKLWGGVKSLFSGLFGKGKGKGQSGEGDPNISGPISTSRTAEMDKEREQIKEAYRKAAEINPDFSQDEPEQKSVNVKARAKEWEQKITEEKQGKSARAKPFTPEDDQRMEKGQFQRTVDYWKDKAKAVESKESEKSKDKSKKPKQ